MEKTFSLFVVVVITRNYNLAPKKTAVINEGWRKLPEGILMINVDAGFDETKGSRSTGAVVRDSTGGFIAASHSYIPHVMDAAMAEAAFLRDGLLLAQQIGCSRVEFQSDCMEVITAIQEADL